MLTEERESLRPKRATHVVSRFEDRQAAELQEREERAEQKRNAQRQRVAQEAAATKGPRERLPSRRLLSLRLRYSWLSTLSTRAPQEGQ
eukprot:4278960-Prymnesium_polylepis.1